MPDFQYARFSEEGQGLFSPAEVERMMRAEYDRAQRHGYPMVVMLIGVDRLGTLADLYGNESREEILEAVIDALRTATRESDYLSYLLDEKVLAVFPHTPPEVGGLVAKKLLLAARKMRFSRDGRTLRISLSIGVSHNRHKGELSFDTLVGVAEEGLAVAEAGGGDRFVETELYQLFAKRRRLRERERELMERDEQFAEAAPLAPLGSTVFAAPAPLASAQSLLGPGLIAMLRARGIDFDPEAPLDPDLIAHLIRELSVEKQGTSNLDYEDKLRAIDLLERRIAKLTHELGVTEEELKRIAAMKNIDLGISSIYRSVQGLGSEEANAERKREMMKNIFEANFELKKKLTGGSG